MSKPGKNNVAYSGFVIPETGELFVMKPGWFNYETVIQSFRDFIKAKPLKDRKKYCIILDNAPWHKKEIIAIILMVVHAIWAIIVLKKDRTEELLIFHRFSIVVWGIWLIPYILEMIMGGGAV